MKIGRRDCLRLGALAGSGTLLSGCSRVVRRYSPPPARQLREVPCGDVEPLSRLSQRLSFGVIPGEMERIAKLGKAGYIEELLNPDDDDETILKLRLHSVEVLNAGAMELRDLHDKFVIQQLQQAAILRAVYSRHQLQERLVDFWSNHFNIYTLKGYGAWFKPVDDLAVIRRHALGRFPDMLRASAHSPAMLTYLDNQANRVGRPNENYARELMELHTLGVGGGYTQRDVQELARCLTGWTVEDRFLRRRGTLRFDAERHDDGSKIFLGVKMPAGQGRRDIEQALDILAAHPGTARFISSKLCRYFLGQDNPRCTASMAAIYRNTGGDIKAMLRPLLLGDELREAPPILKRPFDYMVSALRALNADTDGGAALQRHLARMGQPLYQWPMPDGYPDETSAWAGSLLPRWNFALSLCGGSINGSSIDVAALMLANGNARKQMKTVAEGVLGRSANSADSRDLIEQLVAWRRNATNIAPAEPLALLLASPQFQWR